jgi:chromosomal replication initiator protein
VRPEKVWRAALGELQLQVSRSTFDTWLRDARLVSCEESEYIIGVDSGFARDWLDAHMRNTVERTVGGIGGGAATVSFVVWPQDPATTSGETPLFPAAPDKDVSRQTRAPAPRRSFDDFVVGTGNRMANAAALAVAERPWPGHNPLVLYGGVGLGKTHLLLAIAHECERSGRNALLVTAEDFTNELVAAIRAHTTDSFREKYRTASVLLVDDIQFFVGKKSSRDEFLHTLSARCAGNRQVVLASDQPPEGLAALGPRLCSRLGSGLTTEISPPGASLRAEILRSKAAALAESLPDEVVDFLAEHAGNHVRALEGALHRLMAQARVLGRPVDLTSAADCIGRQITGAAPAAPSDRVIAAVANRFRLTPRELCGKSRSRRVTVPRQLAMQLLREQGDRSLAEIGGLLGGRDHSTVRHGCARARALLSNDAELRSHAEWLRNLLSRAEQPRPFCS